MSVVNTGPAGVYLNGKFYLINQIKHEYFSVDCIDTGIFIYIYMHVCIVQFFHLCDFLPFSIPNQPSPPDYSKFTFFIYSAQCTLFMNYWVD